MGSCTPLFAALATAAVYFPWATTSATNVNPAWHASPDGAAAGRLFNPFGGTEEEYAARVRNVKKLKLNPDQTEVMMKKLFVPSTPILSRLPSVLLHGILHAADVNRYHLDAKAA